MTPTIFSKRPAAAAAAGFGALYVWSAYPTLSPYRDAGDMAAAAWTLGVAHPPGYPLYLLLAHLWAKLLPLGTAAYRLHVFSAAAAAAACAVLVWALRRDEETPAGLVAALLLGLAPAMWHLAQVSEMYALNALVGAALFALLLPGGDAPADRRRLYAAALLFGLGLGNHQTLVAALPGLLLLCLPAFYPDARRFWRARLPALSAFALLGLGLYAYLPLRSLGDPVVDWGEPESWRNFLRMMTRADYGGVRLHPERPPGLAPSQWLAAGRCALTLFARELGVVGLLLAAWGWLRHPARRAAHGAALAALLSGPVFIMWANLDPARAETYAVLEPHLVLPLVFLAALAGWGFAALWRSAGALKSRPPAPARAALVLLCAAGWAWSQWTGPAALRPQARLAYRADYSAYDFGGALLASLPDGALLLDPDDPTAFTLSYLQLAHGRRRDVAPIMYFRTRWGYEQLKKRRPELLPEWEIKSGQQLLGTLVERAFAARRPLFVDLPPKAPPGTTALPQTMAYRLFKTPPAPPQRRAAFARARARTALVRMRPTPGRDFFSQHTLSYWTAALNNAGIEAQRLGDAAAAARLYRRALAVDPAMPEAWNNLANALLQGGDAAGAEGGYLRSTALKPTGQVVYNLGRVYLLGGRLAEAERAFRRAMRLGGPLEARNDLGLVFLRAGRTREAAEHFTALVAEHPSYYLAYYNLALAHEALGDKDKAFAAVRLFERLAPDPRDKAEARNWMKRLHH